MRIHRLLPDGSTRPPLMVRGHLILGNPDLGDAKHLASNAVRVRTEQEAIDLLAKGYSIRIETDTYPGGTMVRRNLFVDGVRIS